MSNNVEQTNSGIAKKGDWKEVAEFAEEVEEAVEDTVRERTIQDLNDWRPRSDEEESDMKKKTVEIATINRSKMEEESKGIKGDFSNASKNIVQAGKKAAEHEAPSKEITEASESFARPFISKAAQLFRDFENIVYSKFALRSERYYLDTEDLSVDLRTTRDGMYRMDVNANTDDSRQRLKEKFKNG